MSESSTPIVCIDCSNTYYMSEQEKGRFEALMKTVVGFQMPRRCPDCRKIRRDEKLRQNRDSLNATMGPVPTYSPRPAPAPAVAEAPYREPQKEEVRFILATKDFEDLVHGRPVVWQNVRVILADIGLKVMREAIDRAELERARTLVKSNGH